MIQLEFALKTRQQIRKILKVSDIEREDQGTNNPKVERKRKRTLDFCGEDLEPYRKKPQIATFEFENVKFCDKPVNLNDVKRLDLSWEKSTFIMKNTPICVESNCMKMNSPCKIYSI